MSSARPATWRRARAVGGAAILGVLVWRVGAGPFVDGLREVDGRPLAVASGIAVLTTVCCAWRWSIVARGLGVGLPLRSAVAACYRSQFLNTVLPGGVLGDVERGVRHGRGTGDTGRGLRAVAWERFAGQVVQIGLTLLLLLVIPSPVRSSMPWVVGVVSLAAVGMGLLARAVPRAGTSLAARTARASLADVRAGLLRGAAWPGIVLASTAALAGHTVAFLVAARTAGSTASLAVLLPLSIIVLLAMGLPLNVAGWGPREGAAAWAFAAAGLGADEGVAAAVVYGVMVLVAGLPGAVVLVAQGLATPTEVLEGASHG